MRCSKLMLGLILLLVMSGAGCVTTKDFEQLKSDVSVMDSRIDRVNSRVDSLKSLTADVEAVRTYFLEVKETVRQMRDDTIRLLDEQRIAIEESRQGYITALRGQQKMLDAVIKDLEKRVPVSEDRVAKEPADPVMGQGAPKE